MGDPEIFVHAAGPSWGMAGLGLAGSALWLSMLVYCAWKDEEERHIWLWLLVFLNVVGALLYLVVRFLPRSGLLAALGRGTRISRQIEAVDADMVHLGEKPHLLQKKAALLVDAGRIEEAEGCLRKALAAAPEEADLRFELGAVLLERGGHAEAAALLGEVVVKDRNFSYGDGLRLFARALFRGGKRAEARPLYEELVRTRPSAEASFHLATLLAEGGDRAGAIALLDRLERESLAVPDFAKGKRAVWLKEARALRRALGA